VAAAGNRARVARASRILVEGDPRRTKESRLAEQVAHPHVLVTGTPFVDVWQAVRPAVVGLTHWPTVPKGQDWKTGICRALGEPDPATCWRRIFGSVHSYADLEPALAPGLSHCGIQGVRHAALKDSLRRPLGRP
jgi:hypothetical protein